MDEETVKAAVGQFLKNISFNAQRELERVVRSALECYPVAALPGETLAAGGTLAIVNRGGTPFDVRAAVVVDGSAGETLAALLEQLS